MAHSVGIVIPAYRPDVVRLCAYVDALDDHVDPDTIRVELDAPRAGALDALDPLPATVNAVPTRRGKGRAITAGFERLETDVLAFVDADGSTPPASIADVIRPVRDGRVELAVGTRRHEDANVVSHQTRVRRRLGDAFAWSSRRLLPVTLSDYQCGAKAIRADAWRDVRADLVAPGFGWDVELIAAVDTLEGRIVEVPITWHDRAGSTVSPVSTPIELLRSVIRARRRSKRIRGDRPSRPVSTGRSHVPSPVDRDQTDEGDGIARDR